jgi:hypothetical protein
LSSSGSAQCHTDPSMSMTKHVSFVPARHNLLLRLAGWIHPTFEACSHTILHLFSSPFNLSSALEHTRLRPEAPGSLRRRDEKADRLNLLVSKEHTLPLRDDLDWSQVRVRTGFFCSLRLDAIRVSKKRRNYTYTLGAVVL